MDVTVTCLSNGYVHNYHDVVSITKGMWFDDDLDCFIQGTRSTFADDTTATFRNGFTITIDV